MTQQKPPNDWPRMDCFFFLSGQSAVTIFLMASQSFTVHISAIFGTSSVACQCFQLGNVASRLLALGMSVLRKIPSGSGAA